VSPSPTVGASSAVKALASAGKLVGKARLLMQSVPRAVRARTGDTDAPFKLSEQCRFRPCYLVGMDLFYHLPSQWGNSFHKYLSANSSGQMGYFFSGWRHRPIHLLTRYNVLLKNTLLVTIRLPTRLGATSISCIWQTVCYVKQDVVVFTKC
jgi:hypothetical protein